MSGGGGSDTVTVTLDGEACELPAGRSVAAAPIAVGRRGLRRDAEGRPRGVLCGMGTCFECTVRIDGRSARACLAPVRPGLRIDTA